MTTWDQVHEAYRLACGEEARPRVLKAFMDVYPEFALDLLEATFAWLEMEWTSRNMPQEPDTPEWTLFLARVRALAVERLDRERAGMPSALAPP